MGGFSPENEEVPQNLGTDVLHFKIFLEVPISLEVHLAQLLGLSHLCGSWLTTGLIDPQGLQKIGESIMIPRMWVVSSTKVAAEVSRFEGRKRVQF